MVVKMNKTNHALQHAEIKQNVLKFISFNF